MTSSSTSRVASIPRYDVFVSYAHHDAADVVKLIDALQERGVRVWYDDRIKHFSSIQSSIEANLRASRVFLAYYSRVYPMRLATQWELTAAFVGASELGDVGQRVIVVNPEPDAEHIHPIQLRDRRYATLLRHADVSDNAEVARLIAHHIGGLASSSGLLPVKSDSPQWYGEIPRASDWFQGRTPQLWEVHSALHASGRSLIGQRQGAAIAAITGVGGAGKSMLAREYATRFGSAYRGGVFWLRGHGHDETVEAASAEFDRQLVDLARQLSSGSPADAADARRLLREWMDARVGLCLWIVDDSPPDLRLEHLDVWVAPGAKALTLLTTRRQQLADLQTIELGGLPEESALAVLCRYAKPEGEAEIAASKQLTDELARHPLALDVAGSYLGQGTASFVEYLELLRDPATDYLEVAAQMGGELPTSHERSVAATLDSSVQKLEGPALELAALAAVLDRAPIPTEVVMRALRAPPGERADKKGNARATLAIAGLRELSLLDVGGGQVDVHALVARMFRYRIDAARQRAMEARAMEAFFEMLQDEPTTSSQSTSLMSSSVPHIRHLLRGVLPDADPMAWALGNWLGFMDLDRGAFKESAAILQALTESMSRHGAGSNPLFQLATNNLGLSYWRLGELERSLELLRRAADLADSPVDYADAVDNVGIVLRELGRSEDAQLAHESALRIRKRMLGSSHMDTVGSLSNLALVLSDLGQVRESLATHERVLQTRLDRLGEMHVETARSLRNIGLTRRRLGDYIGARDALERSLEIRIELLGPTHPDVALTRQYLEELETEG